MKSFIPLLFFCISLMSCGQTTSKNKKAADKDAEPVETAMTKEGYKKAYFASGCFWCSESIFESVIGVTFVIPGYSGGTGKEPTYQTYVRKGHAETVEVTYDPNVIDFESLLTVYFGSQNVTQLNGQGPDQGSGYRSIVFYQNEKEKEITETFINEVQKSHQRPIAAKVEPFQKFWIAEDYHHNYEQRNPDNLYIKNISVPRLNQFKTKHPELLKNSN